MFWLSSPALSFRIAFCRDLKLFFQNSNKSWQKYQWKSRKAQNLPFFILTSNKFTSENPRKWSSIPSWWSGVQTICELLSYEDIRNLRVTCKQLNVNAFEELIHLEVKGVNLEGGKLSLRHVKIAFFENMDCGIGLKVAIIELDCPRLEALGQGFLTQPRLTEATSQSVRHLRVWCALYKTYEDPYGTQLISYLSIWTTSYGSFFRAQCVCPS